MVRGLRMLVPALVSLCAAGCVQGAVVGLDHTAANRTTGGGDGDGDGDDSETGELVPLLDTMSEPICNAPPSISCDSVTTDNPARAMALDCPGGFHDVEASYYGHPEALAVYAGTLGPGTYPPEEGERFAVLSSGRAADLAKTPEELLEDPNCVGGQCPSTNHLDGKYNFVKLPEPIDVLPVHEEWTCTDHPELVGTGDCSNTLFDQWTAQGECAGVGDDGCRAFDYAEIRARMTVPDDTSSFAFDFAFLSVEYPDFYKSSFNDMFIAWLESEEWTGNVSFDAEGNPISVNGSFLDYKDAPNPIDCEAPCSAPALHGFAAEGHGATRWLKSSAGVKEGESIELVFAIFDLNDGQLDSFVLLDAFRWGCDDNPPITLPVD